MHSLQGTSIMNTLKSIYMLVAPLVLMIVIGYAIYQLMAAPFDLSWIAVLLTALPLMVFLMDVMILQSTPRTHEFLPKHTLVVALGLLMILAIALFPSINNLRDTNTFALMLAELSVAIYIAYIFWYSSLQRGQSQLLVKGKKLPAFTVYDDGIEISSDLFLGNPLVIIFYRGNWCPFCVAQVKELVKDYKQLALEGVEFLLISPQPEKFTQAMAKRFDVPFKFLSDPNNNTASQLGINHDNGLPAGMNVLGYSADTVYPTVIVTNSKGKIIYLNETNSFRDRPDPLEYLELITNDKSV